MNKAHYNIQVIGKVQGVWFRKYTKAEAIKMDLKGTVRNKNNGNVYIEVEGNRVTIENFINWLYIGSPQSKVAEVIYEVSHYIGYDKFEIMP